MIIHPKKSDRFFVVGKSGSGKTTLGLELAQAGPRPLLIIDTKYSPSIADYAKKRNWKIVNDFPTFRKDDDAVVWRPPPEFLAEPMVLDSTLVDLTDGNSIPLTIFIDELYQFHSNGRAGAGIVGLYTRGREIGHCVIGGSQRPSWVSVFCLTESNKHVVMRLQLPADRKRMIEVLDAPELSEPLPPWYFWYVEEGEEPILCAPVAPALPVPPVALDKSGETEYTLIQ